MFDTHRIAANLRQLRELDRHRVGFGASGHQYDLHPKLPEATVAAFEARHVIQLPDDYRRFLIEVGNGGAGPFYGIFRLGEMDDSFDFTTWQEGNGFVGSLSAPFPHSGPWNLPSARLNPPEEFESDEAKHRWYDELDELYWNPALVNGAIPICHHGCALRTWLVVTGAERGHVWFDGRAEYSGLRPHGDPAGARLTFAAWYEAWLAEALAEMESGGK